MIFHWSFDDERTGYTNYIPHSTLQTWNVFLLSVWTTWSWLLSTKVKFPGSLQEQVRRVSMVEDSKRNSFHLWEIHIFVIGHNLDVFSSQLVSIPDELFDKSDTETHCILWKNRRLLWCSFFGWKWGHILKCIFINDVALFFCCYNA